MDLDALTAIDTHVHVEKDSHGHLSLDQELLDAATEYFRGNAPITPTVEDLAGYYRERNIAAVVFSIDATTGLRHPALNIEELLDEAAGYPDVLIPFGSVDPHTGDAAVRRVRSQVTEHGARGMKFHPTVQAFEPNDPAYYPLWAAIEELGVPALFHTGQTGIGAGLPGARGLKLRYSNPMLLDDIAADFPGLTLIMAHPSVPWQDEAISIATHKTNVYIDLSGWSPKYFPAELVRAANGLLSHKVLFGSDYPLISPDRWLADFANLDIKDGVRPLILKENAIQALGLRA